MCGYCHNPNDAPEKCVQHISDAIQIIYDHVPRVIVSLTVMLHLEVLRLTDSGHFFCTELHVDECGCESDKGYNNSFLLTSHYHITQACVDYANREIALGNSGKFDKEDFTLVVQPFFRDIVTPPMKVKKFACKLI
ncbi:unnamed protein product [Cylicostephanus goldi]|uniref:Uncharacterized protein n=1 Tax=Cylicostephanus goldi TaxID=71465 RepID=A0A3P6R070_CYLGO|nr:unnamed protein product [Cylicostephanus goldi]